jgi:hypothetical protein
MAILEYAFKEINQSNQSINEVNMEQVTIAGTLDTLQSLEALDSQNQLHFMQNGLTAIAQAVIAKQNADKTELNDKQVADNANALNLIRGLQVQVSDALVRADNLGSAELAQLEASIKATIEGNPQLLAVGIGAINVDGSDYTVASVLKALLVAPKTIKYENKYDAELNINGAIISTSDGLVHVFEALSIDDKGVRTVIFGNRDFYGSNASFECVFSEQETQPIVTGGLTISMPSKWLKVSHTNILISLKDLVNYVAPAELATPDLNSDGVIGIPS